jgi:hypothetical protein
MKLYQLTLTLQGNYFTEAASSPINDGCQPYYFLFTLENGAVHRYPETHHFNTFSDGACANNKCSSTAAGNSGAICLHLFEHLRTLLFLRGKQCFVRKAGEDAIEANERVRRATLPGPPQNVAVSSVTPTSAVVSWSAPLNDGASPISSYQVGLVYVPPLICPPCFVLLRSFVAMIANLGATPLRWSTDSSYHLAFGSPFTLTG